MGLSEENLKANILVAIATLYDGFTEVGGDNKGQMVERFQKAVDGKAHGEAWCVSAIQYWIGQAQVFYDSIFMQTSPLKPLIYSTEHVMTCWRKTSTDQRIGKPEVGCLILWQHYKYGKPTDLGHIGLVSKVLDDNTVVTIEGNTSDSNKVNRDGDGVYSKTRIWRHSSGSMRHQGFLKVW